MTNEPEHEIWEIPRRFADKRLDSAFCELYREKRLRDVSRALVSRLIEQGRISLNDQPAKPRSIVCQHDMIGFFPHDLLETNSALEPKAGLSVDIICETDHVLAINKPSGLQVHPARGQERETLAHFLLTSYPSLKFVGENEWRPGIVHRLDRETSGVMVIAKTQAAFDALKKIFHDRQAEKSYIALVYGHLSVREGVIDKPLFQRSGELRRYALGPNQLHSDKARPAETAFRVIAKLDGCEVLLAQPKTGRTHQIRVHLASIGHPVVGDTLYGGKRARQERQRLSGRLWLHSWKLAFELFGEKYALTAPLPHEFRQKLRDIDESQVTSYDNEALNSLLSE